MIHREYRAPETPKDEEKRVNSSKNNFERAGARDKEEERTSNELEKCRKNMKTIEELEKVTNKAIAQVEHQDNETA